MITGQYKGLTRYVGNLVLYRLSRRNGPLELLLALVVVMSQLPLRPRSSSLLLWLLLRLHQRGALCASGSVAESPEQASPCAHPRGRP